MMQQLVLFLAFFIFNAACYSQGKIDDAEESLKKSKTALNAAVSSYRIANSSHKTASKSSENILTEIVGGLFIQLFAYTAYGIVFESPFEIDTKASNAILTKYPYKNGSFGFYTYEWNEDSEIFTTTISSRLVFKAQNSYGNHLRA